MNTFASNSVSAPRAPFGVLYFVDENPAYRDMLAVSLESLRRFHPEWPVQIVQVASRRRSPALRAYRLISFWKWHKRRVRCDQDTHIIARKVDAQIGTPFETTLYLDVDTVLLRPIDDLAQRAQHADVLATPLPWKRFHAREPWQPAAWPYVMAGVMFYSRAYAAMLTHYLQTHFPQGLVSIPMTDMFVFSLICARERQALRIVEDPRLQVDVLNLAPLLATADYPRRDDLIDLTWNRLRDYRFFHYNEQKPRYLAHVREAWKLTGANGWHGATVVRLP